MKNVFFQFSISTLNSKSDDTLGTNYPIFNSIQLFSIFKNCQQSNIELIFNLPKENSKLKKLTNIEKLILFSIQENVLKL